MSAGPRTLTIDEYKARTGRKKNETKEHPEIPKLNRPIRRGGYIWRLRKERSQLQRQINSNPPPSWDKATELWRIIDNIEFQIKQYHERNWERRNNNQ